MAYPRRIYLDNAATSWPKPDAVYAAVDQYLRQNGAPAGRGAYRHATDADRIVNRARSAVAGLIGAAPRQIVFAFNGTDALNLAIHGLVRPGDHVVCSDVEHNSVLRPLRDLEDAGIASVTRVRCDAAGRLDPDDIRAALQPKTRLVVATHASNVTGIVQPAAEIGRIAHEHGALFLLDAAQTLGHLPLAVENLHVDLLAAPGHKGLLGPLGTGVLYVRSGIERELASLRQGGTGTHSENDGQPQSMPDKYESGNLNVPGLAGLIAGIEYLQSQTLEQIHQRELVLLNRLREGLAGLSGVRCFWPSTSAESVAVASIQLPGYDPQEAAALLDSEFGIQVRAGLHCAPRMHRALDTLSGGGTIRFSLGPFNTESDVAAVLDAVQSIGASQPG